MNKLYKSHKTFIFCTLQQTTPKEPSGLRGRLPTGLWFCEFSRASCELKVNVAAAGGCRDATTDSTGMHGWQERVAAGSGLFWRLASSYGLQTLISMAAEFWEGQEKLQDSVCLRLEVTKYPFCYTSHPWLHVKRDSTSVLTSGRISRGRCSLMKYKGNRLCNFLNKH